MSVPTEAGPAVVADDLIIVSVDDHVVEPPDLFVGRISSKYADRAPQVVRNDLGQEMWRFEGVDFPNFGLNAVAGRPQEEFGVEPTSFAEIRNGCYDVHARIVDMNAGGVLGSMSFPSWPQFCGQAFTNAFVSSGDEAFVLEVLRAYNDWHVEDWCGAYPDRLIPLIVVPYWNPELMAAEVYRNAARGVRAVSFSENPSKLGNVFTGFEVPSFHSEHWDPFWRACEETATVVCLHIGSSSGVKMTTIDSPFATMMNLQPTAVMDTAADLLWSRVIREFPGVKFALSEGGLGWIPYLLERADWVQEHHHVWTGSGFGDRLPSEVFREHFVACFISDEVGLQLIDRIGVDAVCVEMDYPHSDSTWPVTPERLAPQLSGLSASDVAKVTHLNAMRLFGFDPFAIRDPSSCTAAALRADAGDVDVGPAAPRRPFVAPARPLTMTDMLNAAAHPLLDDQAQELGLDDDADDTEGATQ
ncbi:MAG: amidohydrolase family protein [Actinomycetes bacterium]